MVRVRESEGEGGGYHAGGIATSRHSSDAGATPALPWHDHHTFPIVPNADATILSPCGDQTIVQGSHAGDLLVDGVEVQRK